ncbi:hypothetical protein GCM10023200_17860 [Actinomycetospora chlora]|uniref:Uncharacterized protein n=1 Tax=Actinomycetospora chlora TaxID=663608 RepID=A0ABP9APZ4_9PSEU
MAALAATGALIVGGGAAAMVGSGNAEPLVPLPVPVAGTTYVLPDLAPFAVLDNRGDGAEEVSAEHGAPTGGGEASLRLTTPSGTDKASIATDEDAGTPLAAWIPAAAYSAFQAAAENPDQFPSMQLAVDYDPSDPAVGFSTLTYEPIYNAGDSRTPGVWHRYQAGAGRWCSTRAIPGVIDESQRSCSNGGAKTLAEYVAAQPGIVVSYLVINQGSGNPGLDAAVDLVSTPSTTYDFELTEPQLPGTDPCEQPSTPPAHPGDGGNGHEDDGNNGNNGDSGHEDEGNGGHEPSDGGQEPSHGDGHEQPDNGGHEQPPGGGHEPPHCAGS